MKQYQQIFARDQVELVVEDDALVEIAKKTLEYNTGARGLRSVIEKLLMKYMYDVPSDNTITKVVITKDVVDGNAEPLIERGPGAKKDAGSEKPLFANKQKA